MAKNRARAKAGVAAAQDMASTGGDPAAQAALAPLARLLWSCALLRLQNNPRHPDSDDFGRVARIAPRRYGEGLAFEVWTQAPGAAGPRRRAFSGLLAGWAQRSEDSGGAFAPSFPLIAIEAHEACEAMGERALGEALEASAAPRDTPRRPRPDGRHAEPPAWLGLGDALRWLADGTVELGPTAKLMAEPAEGQDLAVRSILESAVLARCAAGREALGRAAALRI